MITIVKKSTVRKMHWAIDGLVDRNTEIKRLWRVIKHENDHLKENVSNLEEENSQLKAEVANLKRVNLLRSLETVQLKEEISSVKVKNAKLTMEKNRRVKRVSNVKMAKGRSKSRFVRKFNRYSRKFIDNASRFTKSNTKKSENQLVEDRCSNLKGLLLLLFINLLFVLISSFLL